MLLLVVISVLCVYNTEALITCLKCSHITGPANCSTVQKCGSHQSCFTDVYLNVDGEKRYNLGCRDTMQCDVSRAVLNKADSAYICSECCNGTLCNNAGCQYQGYPSPRGPICYNCDSGINSSDCDTIKVCNSDEVCKLERKYKRLANTTVQFHYQKGCEKADVCDTQLRTLEYVLTHIIRKRQIRDMFPKNDHCILKCCDTDLCTDSCTSRTSPHNF
ncbi:uncharacterized protein LOC132726262 isoform X2 [Ruditapes philippinarum]|nr:uncharacterized protein LOC132726262 isoform X2 [Ruditapes philippinarum]